MIASGIEITLRTLLRSSNPAATDLLVVALESADSTLRVGSVRALAMRADPAGHRALVERRHRLAPDAQAAVIDVPSSAPLAGSLCELVNAATPRLARRAVETAVAWGCVDALPAAVGAALWPGDLAGAFAGDALRLAERLERELREYDPSAFNRDGAKRSDPAFARRAAVNALAAAVDTYDEDTPRDLLSALLLLTPRDEPSLWTALRDRSHRAHDALLDAVRTSRCRGALGVLAHAITDPRAPQEVLDLASERADREGLETMLSMIAHPLGSRVRENCQRIESFAWLDPERVGVLVELSGPAQATAIGLAAASRASRRRVAEAISLMIRRGQPIARRDASRGIDRLPNHLAVEVLAEALDCGDASAIAAAARLLRKKEYPNAVGALVRLLDHEDERVREAAQRSLRELSFASFRDTFETLTAADRPRVGQLIGKADPTTRTSLVAELGSGAVGRRIGALAMIETMGLAGRMVDAIVPLLSDRDSGVRAEAARLLADADPTPELFQALQDALGDRSASVRDAVERSVIRLGGAVRPAPEAAL